MLTVTRNARTNEHRRSARHYYIADDTVLTNFEWTKSYISDTLVTEVALLVNSNHLPIRPAISWGIDDINKMSNRR